jgi:phage tail tape-measure protein
LKNKFTFTFKQHLTAIAGNDLKSARSMAMTAADHTARIAGGLVGGVHGLTILASTISQMVLKAICSAEGRSAFLYGRPTKTANTTQQKPSREPTETKMSPVQQRMPCRERGSAKDDGQKMPSTFVPIEGITLEQLNKVRVQPILP